MSAKLAYIIGGGAHAHVIASILDRSVTFVVAQASKPDEMSLDEFFAKSWPPGEIEVFLGVGDNAGRRREFDRLRALGLSAGTCVAPTAWIARDAHIGAGTVICPGAVIGSRSVVGDNVIVNTLSSVDHDCRIGDDTHVSAGVTFGGGVSAGLRCFIGLKTAIIPQRKIGNDVTIMAGSLVVEDLRDGVLAGGSPARVMRA